jgi:hypothetical protein
MYVENEGKVPATIVGGQEELDRLGITNDRIHQRYDND